MKNKKIFFAVLVFIKVDLVCIDFREKKIIFEEVVITLCLCIGYEPQINQNMLG